MTGGTVGNYRIVRELGAGAMGAVYEGVDVMLDRPVAIKVLRAEIAAQPELVERFRVEAVTLAKLNHPNIATLFSFFRELDQYYMVMEYVPGRSLDRVLSDAGRLSPSAAVDILRQMLDGIGHAHSLGVLHRDIKPANIMVTPEGQVKVTDFGIARILGSARMTRDGGIFGTLEYIAPERIRGEESDPRSDLYSAGVVLFEMLAGRLPFVSSTDYALLQAHLLQPPPALSQLSVPCPPALEAVLGRALAKSAGDRHQSAGQFCEELLAAVPRPQTRSTAYRPAPPPAAAPSRKTLWLALAGGVAMVLLVSLAALLTAQRKPAPAPAPPPAAAAAPAPAPAPAPPPVQEQVLPAPAADPVVVPVKPPRVPAASVRSIADVRKLYIDRLGSGLDEPMAAEIRDQLPRLTVVAARDDADAILTGSAVKRSYSRFTSGLRDQLSATATISAKNGGRQLWTAEEGDLKTGVVFKHGGPKKVAERLVGNLKKAIEKQEDKKR